MIKYNIGLIDLENIILLIILLYFLGVDECTHNGHPCHMNAVCTQVDGEPVCVCKVGYSGDGFNCTGKNIY